MRILKILSALLDYPTPALIAAADELKTALSEEAALSRDHRAALERLIEDLTTSDLLEAQETYLLLFDRTRSLSLHLFEHVHGESRERGQAMVDLIKVYEDGGYRPTARQLPDYLPLFLEFASTLPRENAIELIQQPAHVFAALYERLAKRQSPYAAAFAALVALSRTRPDEAALAALRAEPDPEPDDLEALDAAWAEEEVLFGPGAAADSCGKESLIAKIRQARRPAPGMVPDMAPGVAHGVQPQSRPARAPIAAPSLHS